MPSSFRSRRAAAICTRSSTRHPANSRLLMFRRTCPAGNRPGGERAHCPCQHPFPHIQPGLSSAHPCRSHTVYTLQRIVVSVGTCLPADCVQTKALIRGNGWTNRVKARLPSAAQRTATRNDRIARMTGWANIRPRRMPNGRRCKRPSTSFPCAPPSQPVASSTLENVTAPASSHSALRLPISTAVLSARREPGCLVPSPCREIL